MTEFREIIETGATVETVELPNGVRLQYVGQGDPSGIPVVLLHGVTDSWRSFEPVLPHLPDSINAYALTQRGHGDSGRPALGYRPQDFAADVAAFMNAVELESAVVAGHSLGSTVAQRFALDYPERTLGLVAMGSFFTYRSNPVVMEFWEEGVSQLTDPIAPDFAREFQESTLAGPVPPMFLDTVVGESLKVPARVWRAALEGLLENEFPGELGGIEAPTLIVWGEEDVFAPRGDQAALAAAIPNSRLAVYPGVGHALHWERPERFAADLASFAESVVA